MVKERDTIVQEAFARQAAAYARSALQTSPERLRRLLDFLDPRAGDAVLDVACGPGIVTGALVERGLLAVGVDLTAEMIRQASGTGAGLYARANAARLPFRDGVFDAALCRNSFHHVTDAGIVLGEMVRVTRTRGLVVVEDMIAPTDPAQRDYQATIERLRDVSHSRSLTRDEFRSLAGAAGLTGFDEVPIAMVIDFEEWIDRAYPTPGNRERARAMMEACVAEDLCGLRVWREDGRLKFERRSLLWKARRASP
jgi:ubiquinone/menaquinone biosynthesis C-methylase UbiE